MKWSVVGVSGLHLASWLSALLSGWTFHSSPGLGCVGVLISALLLSAVLSRALRVDEDCEMLMSALDKPTDFDDAITLPQIQVPEHEPSTGVKMKTIGDAPPRVVTWHGRRGKS